MRKLQELIKNARFWRFFNLYMVGFWLLMIPVSFLTGIANETWFVTVISLIALALSSQSSWQGSRNEEKEDNRDPDTETKKIREIVKPVAPEDETS